MSHRESLIAWVAQRRMIQPHACGLTEHITTDVVGWWGDLTVDLYPGLHDDLHLPSRWRRLPIVIDPIWPAESRAGLTWCWKQIANGRWEWLPHHGDRQGTSRLLRFVGLPHDIEPAQSIPAKPQRGLRLGVGAS